MAVKPPHQHPEIRLRHRPRVLPQLLRPSPHGVQLVPETQKHAVNQQPQRILRRLELRPHRRPNRSPAVLRPASLRPLSLPLLRRRPQLRPILRKLLPPVEIPHGTVGSPLRPRMAAIPRIIHVVVHVLHRHLEPARPEPSFPRSPFNELLPLRRGLPLLQIRRHRAQLPQIPIRLTKIEQHHIPHSCVHLHPATPLLDRLNLSQNRHLFAFRFSTPFDATPIPSTFHATFFFISAFSAFSA